MYKNLVNFLIKSQGLSSSKVVQAIIKSKQVQTKIFNQIFQDLIHAVS